MSKTREQSLAEEQRMHILKALALRPSHRADPRGLRAELEVTGYPMSLATLAVHCSWLAEFGLLSAPAEGQITLNDDGVAVARGLVSLQRIGNTDLGG